MQEMYCLKGMTNIQERILQNVYENKCMVYDSVTYK